MIESGRYREKVESVRVPRNFPDEYRKIVESGSVPENDRIRAITGKRSNPCDYREKVESVRVPRNFPDDY